MKPYISVIVPTTRVGGLDILFSSLQLQTFQDFELILVDSLYENRKQLIEEKANNYFFKIKHLKQRHGSTYLCSAMNNALVQADGELAHIIGDYSWLDNDCLEQHARFHTKEKPNKEYALAGSFTEHKLPHLHTDFYRKYAASAIPDTEEGKKIFVKEERECYENYISDINNGKLNNLMWSVFEKPFNTNSNPLYLEKTLEKEKCTTGPMGETNYMSFFLKNETYVLDTLIDINGFNEKLDGSHGWQDYELVNRLSKTTNTKLFYKKDPMIRLINPKPILYSRFRERDIISNGDVFEDSKKNGFRNDVNNWSLKEERNKRILT